MSRQNRPLKRNDANWLLEQFLAKRFPHSGIFRTAPKSRAFVEFVKQPAYAGHPYTKQWLSELERDVPIVEVLVKNLKILRSCEKVNSTKSQNIGYKKNIMVKETYYKLGGPGTGMAYDQAKENELRGNNAAKREAKKANKKTPVKDVKESAASSGSSSKTIEEPVTKSRKGLGRKGMWKHAEGAKGPEEIVYDTLDE
jgi:hypothetical protein